ncbi:MAG: hypothetical protein M1358_15470 [Chloroflexi bacterium]|nr:hypothetical protein [Chloroflexota bacterium]
MLFFVKTEVRPGKADELARKKTNREIQPVEGNMVYVSSDGMTGYNIVEAKDEADVCRLFNPYDAYVILKEVAPVESMGQYLERWKGQHGLSGKTPGISI